MKKALVTGASRGIGRACALALKEAGYDIFINYNHSQTQAEALAKELGAAAVQADVSDPDAVASMAEQTGDVDLLVCNAGISLIKMFCDTTAEDWNRILNTNLLGAVNCIRAYLPGMVHRKSGSIVTVSSMWGQTGASCEVAYSASKAAVIGLTRSLAKELGPSGIRVNCVAPGVIATEMNAELSEDTLDQLKEETPLGVIGRPEDVAKAVCYLAQAPFVTGQILGVNGGILI